MNKRIILLTILVSTFLFINYSSDRLKSKATIVLEEGQEELYHDIIVTLISPQIEKAIIDYYEEEYLFDLWEVKNYIINGQGDKSEAEKLKWSSRFLNEVDIDSIYSQYLSENNNGDDIERFAQYITLNAPILNNWEELFKEDLYDAYGKEVTRVEPLEGDLYQAYVMIEGKEVPYVVVSARTGNFHG